MYQLRQLDTHGWSTYLRSKLKMFGRWSLLHMFMLFSFFHTADSACSTGCSSCTESTCKNCGPSYFLSSGNCQKCPDNCKTCDTYDHCTSCQSDKYGLADKCILTCATACLNGECRDDTGHCYGCKPGTYGIQCQQNCSLCKDGLCDLRSCRLGCAPGYYEYNTDTVTLCLSCVSDCKSCNNSTACSVCNDGFYVYSLLSNGKSFDYCNQCPPQKNCKSCELVQSTSIVCTGCKEGYILGGDKCIVNDNSCSSGCSTECDENGICLGSCKEGWTGEQCSDPCASRCQKCLKNNAGLCIECNGDFYTNACSTACSSLCTRITGTQTCRINDGYCLNGCDNKFWGSHCNQSCSNGCVNDDVSRVCDRDSGTCTNGCNDGYDGDTCEAVITSKQPIVTEETSGGKMTHVRSTETTTAKISAQCLEEVNSYKGIAIGFASGIGTSVFVAVVTATLYCIRQRYVTRNSKQHKESHGTTDISTYSNETFDQIQMSESPDNGATNYERLGNNRNVEKVYSELERPEVQMDHKYYNMDFQ